MSQPCKEQDKIRGKFIRAYYSNSAGGGGYKEDLTEAAARAKAAEMRKKGYQFGESELPAKYSCWWGDPAFQHITIEYEAYCKIQLTSETANKLPKNRNRTTIGVGEAVTVRSNIPVLWEIQSNLVKPSSVKSKTPSNEITFSALDKAGSVTVKAKTKHDQGSITFSIIEPQRLTYYQSYHADSSPMIFHPKDSLSAVVGLMVIVEPTSVNFNGLSFQEIDEASQDTGIYIDDKEKHCHIAGNKNINEECDGKNIRSVNDDNKGNHNRIGGNDIVGVRSLSPSSKIGILQTDSSMKLNIQIMWGLGGNKELNKKLRYNVTQITTLFKNGSFHIMKGNYNINIPRDKDYPNNSFIPKFRNK
jgi:hypothetical protein